MRCSPADQPVVVVKLLLAGVGVERRGWLIRTVRSFNRSNAAGGSEENMPTSQAKPFDIPKQQVWEAYRRIAANKGAAGVDEVALEDFESDLKNNLYKVWNRMSSGSYFPPPVKGVEIPKPHGGGVRLLGVPGNADATAAFRDEVTRLWFRALRRRSQRTRVTWERMRLYVERWLPPIRPMHPFPIVRFNVRTQGRSPLR